jgi:hypothetical protein
MRPRCVVVCVALLASISAHASAPNCPQAPAPPPPLQVPDGVVVVSADVHVDCAAASWPSCGLRVVATLRAAAAVDGEVALVGAAAATPLALAAGATRTMELTGALRFDDPRSSVPGCARYELPAPIEIRHLLLARGERRGETILDLRGGDLTVEVATPPGWDMELASGACHTAGRSGALACAGRDALVVRRRERPTLAQSAGPFLAVGGSGVLGGEDSLHLTLRAGYELAWPSWVITSLAVETDLAGVVVVPTVEAAVTGNWSQVIAAGVGAPVRLDGETTVGLRLQAAIQFPILGGVWAWDYFPGDGWRVAIFGQLSL